MICDICANNGIEVIFLESLCDDPEVIRANILVRELVYFRIFNLNLRKSKLTARTISAWIKTRPLKISRKGSCITKEHTSLCTRTMTRIIRLFAFTTRDWNIWWTKFMVSAFFSCISIPYHHSLKGNLQSRIVYYLMNIRPVKRTIYICRVSPTIFCFTLFCEDVPPKLISLMMSIVDFNLLNGCFPMEM